MAHTEVMAKYGTMYLQIWLDVHYIIENVCFESSLRAVSASQTQNSCHELRDARRSAHYLFYHKLHNWDWKLMM
jgi:hypothetical protein